MALLLFSLLWLLVFIPDLLTWHTTHDDGCADGRLLLNVASRVDSLDIRCLVGYMSANVGATTDIAAIVHRVLLMRLLILLLHPHIV